MKKKKALGIVGTVLVSAAGTLASVLVTMYLKKMLADRGMTVGDVKDVATDWVSDKSAQAADLASSVHGKVMSKLSKEDL